jgi:hypothetical protein
MTIVDEIEAGLRALIQTVVGLFFMLGGAGFLWLEYRSTPAHGTHLIAGLVVSLVGAAILPSVGPALIAALKGVVGVLLSVFPARTPKDGAP